MLKLLLILFLGVSAFSTKADTANKLPKDVSIIVPYGPGGISDVQIRHLTQWLSKKGINLNPIFKPGGNSTLAANELISSNKDGSVLMINSTSNSLLAEQRFGKKVIDPIISTGGTGQVMITFSGSKYEKYENFISALQNSDPDIKIGWHSVATVLNLHQLSSRTGTFKPLLIPYKTSTDSSRDVAGRHLPLALVPLATAMPWLESGKVKVVFGFMPTSGKSGLPTDVIDLKSRIPSWTHDEIFFIGLPPDTDKKISRIWYQLLEEWLNDKETEEVFKKAYFGKDVKNADQIVSVIKHQGTMIKKFNVDIK